MTVIRNKAVDLDTLSRGDLIAVLRHLLKSNFYAFCKYYDSNFFSDDKPHLVTICNALQDVADGKIKKLAISLPPRAGKSYAVSLWSAWLIGRESDNPDLSIMRNSYGQTLAEKFSFDVKQICLSDKYQDIFPEVKLKTDHSRIEDWAITTAKQSTYFCSGVGGAITGKGCKTAAILDDPIKNLEDALSDTILEKTWGWYISTHKSRIETNCPEVHIATRWSKKDIIGKLIESEPNEWTTIVIPALDSNGKSFCESIKTTKEYLELKKLLDPYIWESEFMQNPIESKGLLYPSEELKYFSLAELEKYINPNYAERFDSVIGYTDIADEGLDYLASGALAAIGDKYYLIDVIYTQDPIEVTQPMVADMIIATNQVRHILESNNGGKSFGIKVKELLRERKSYCSVKWVPNTKNKETRILMSSGIIKEHFYFRNDYSPGSHYDLFMRALTSYVKAGKNKHDDAPDMLAGLVEMIQKNTTFRFLTNRRT